MSFKIPRKNKSYQRKSMLQQAHDKLEKSMKVDKEKLFGTRQDTTIEKYKLDQDIKKMKDDNVGSSLGFISKEKKQEMGLIGR